MEITARIQALPQELQDHFLDDYCCLTTTKTSIAVSNALQLPPALQLNDNLRTSHSRAHYSTTALHAPLGSEHAGAAWLRSRTSDKFSAINDLDFEAYPNLSRYLSVFVTRDIQSEYLAVDLPGSSTDGSQVRMIAVLGDKAEVLMEVKSV